MGKSPGKWIKSVFGKKSSKSSLTKGKESRSANAEETLIPANIPAACDLRSIPPPLTSLPLPSACVGNGVLSTDNNGKQDGGDAQIVDHTGPSKDLQNIKLEHAVTKVQAATRGFLARRAFGSLKGIAYSAEKMHADTPMTRPTPVDSGVHGDSTEKDIAIVESALIDAENADIAEESVIPSVASEPTDSLHGNDLTSDRLLTMNKSNRKSEDIHNKVNGLHYTDDRSSEYNGTTSRRRAFLAGKQDGEENGIHNTPRVPSYMAATESAKARLRMQGSPMFENDNVEKNGFTRRHSLPSLTNGKLITQSPRVQKLVQSGGKIGLRSDKSLTSSRDGSDTAIQPGWRR